MQLNSYIKSYLEIPVVLGIGMSRVGAMTYTHVTQQIHQGQTPERIKASIRYLLSNLPENYDFHEEEVHNYRMYVYKIDDQHRFVTLLLHENNVIRSFRAPQLIRKIAENVDASLKLFQELSLHQTLGGDPIVPCDEHLTSDQSRKEHKRIHDLPKVTVQEVLEAFNYLSRFAKKYIGPKIVSNYWALSRPQHPWLDLFEIKFSAAIRFKGDKGGLLSPVQVLVLREWTQNFMRHCHTIIQDLPDRFEEEDIPLKTRKIISIYTSEYLKTRVNVEEDHSEGLFSDVFLNVNI